MYKKGVIGTSRGHFYTGKKTCADVDPRREKEISGGKNNGKNQ